jgi:hypothetical protein
MLESTKLTPSLRENSSPPTPSTPASPAKKGPTPATPAKRDPTSARVIEGLKLLYHEKLHPIENKYVFGSFHYQPISDAEIEVRLVEERKTGGAKRRP